MAEENAGGGLKLFGTLGLGGIIAALITAYASCHNQSSIVEQKTFEIRAQQDLQTSEFKAQEDLQTSKLDAEHQAKELERLDAEVKAANDIANANPGKYWTVDFKNSCDVRVYLARRYTGLDGQVIVEGWYNIGPGETGGGGLRTQSRDIYWYAYGKGWTWAGDTSILISGSEPFTYLDDSYFHAGWMKLPGTSKTVGFRRNLITSEYYGPYTQELTCTKSEPLKVPENFKFKLPE